MRYLRANVIRVRATCSTIGRIYYLQSDSCFRKLLHPCKMGESIYYVRPRILKPLTSLVFLALTTMSLLSVGSAIAASAPQAKRSPCAIPSYCTVAGTCDRLSEPDYKKQCGAGVCCHPNKKKLCEGRDSQVGYCETGLCGPESSVIGICKKENRLCCSIQNQGDVSVAPSQIDTEKKLKPSDPATNSKSKNALEAIATSSLFTFLAGLTSIMGLLATVFYPVQIRNVPPSEYRSL